MKQIIYDAVLEVLSRHTFFHSGLTELQTKFPDILDTVSVKTLRSIQAQYYVRRMKRSTARHYNRRTREKYYQLYTMAKARGEDHVIVRLALRNDLSPCLLARILLEEYYWKDVQHDRVRNKPDGTRGSLPPGLITELLRDVSRIPNPCLAHELYESMVLDNFYGPVIDSIKKCCGSEYEVILTSCCRQAGLTFIDEDQMRRDGYDKTPDIKLDVPIMVNNQVVNWIESKASFGDPTNHHQYMADQFLPYRNRFGPGAVIYWFGFVDELALPGEAGIQLWGRFPADCDIVRLEDALRRDRLYAADATCGLVDIVIDPDPVDPQTAGSKAGLEISQNGPLYDYVDPMFDCLELSTLGLSLSSSPSSHLQLQPL